MIEIRTYRSYFTDDMTVHVVEDRDELRRTEITLRNMSVANKDEMDNLLHSLRDFFGFKLKLDRERKPLEAANG